VALRAVIQVLDRTLGRPRQQQAPDRSFKGGGEMESVLAEAREKLALRLEGRAARTLLSSGLRCAALRKRLAKRASA
jgi:hypothetical protein